MTDVDRPFIERMDAAHRAAIDAFPAALFAMSDIPAARLMLAELFEAAAADAGEDADRVLVTDHLAAGPEGDPDVLVRLYRPVDVASPAPVLYWIHGGGMVMGDVAMNDTDCKVVASEVGCVVASVEYRLAPEHPFPAGIEDCYAGLSWLVANASEHGIDPVRVAVGGASAGGGLAASLALLVRDRAEFRVAFQWLIYPMLDHRCATPSSHLVTHAQAWNHSANVAAWAAYLGEVDLEHVSPYASAARAASLVGLPPTHLSVGELDLFLDECADYAMRLTRDGVATDFHVYPGAFHGSDTFVPDAAVTRRWVRDRLDALHDALGGRVA